MLTKHEQSPHQQAMKLSQIYDRVERLFILTLQQIDRTPLFKKLGVSSLLPTRTKL